MINKMGIICNSDLRRFRFVEPKRISCIGVENRTFTMAFKITVTIVGHKRISNKIVWITGDLTFIGTVVGFKPDLNAVDKTHTLGENRGKTARYYPQKNRGLKMAMDCFCFSSVHSLIL